MAATTKSARSPGTARATKAAARTQLSRDVVADRAIALADAEGLDAVTIRRLATELGVTPMALYWHFRTKEDLLAGLGERVLDTVVMPERTGAWDVDLRAALSAVVTAMRPHPELAELVAEQVMLNPKGLALTELALATLSEAGLAPEPTAWFAMRALRTVVGLVTGDPVLNSGMADDAREAHQRQKAARIAALSPKEFPALIAHAEAMAYCSDVEMFVNLGLDHFIAGVKGLAPLR